MRLPTPTLAARQVLGRRKRQEDYYGIVDLSTSESRRLALVLADGMGGHPAAADAARLVVEHFCAAILQRRGPLSERLRPALEHANRALAQAGDRFLAGAGTTLLAAVIEGERLNWISVGDSFLYLIVPAGKIHRLNRPHTKAPMAEAARPGARDTRTRTDPKPHLLSALTGKPLTLIDQPADSRLLQPGDCLIVASDGIETLSPDEILETAARAPTAPPSRIAARLVRRIARAKDPRQDNVTVIIYRWPVSGKKRRRFAGFWPRLWR